MMMEEKRTGDWSLYSESMVSRLHSISTQDKQTKIREGFQCMNGRICMTVESVAGYPVRGFAYPFGSYTPEILSLLPSLGIRYGRIVGDSDGFALPDDFYLWKATCHHNHRLMENAESFLAIKNDYRLSLMYVWGHSYEFTT